MFYAAKSGMNALPKLLLALTAAAVLSFIQPAKANLIVNPGFEQGFPNYAPWQISGGQTLNTVTGTFNGVAPHSGNFQWVEGPTIAPGQIRQSVATTPGATYTIDFFVATTGVTSPMSLTATFGNTVFSHLFIGNTGYTEFTFNATAPASSSTLNFSVTGIGYLLLDDVSVEPAGVGVPDGGTTVSLLGCALLGLAAVRRKLGC
jgi:hypothetical protein